MGEQRGEDAGVAGHPANILWYGERGVVNSVVTHLFRDGVAVNPVRALLSAIEWADGGIPGWIGQVTDVRVVVEMGLADFGDPDLMIVCTTSRADLPYCVFLEAKAVPYTFSMAENSAGMAPGFNSSINGQLTLKYRFARALGNPGSHAGLLVEPEGLFHQYEGRLRDYNKRPRRLQKAKVLRSIADLRLMGIPEERCCYVAWTWDDQAHAFFRDKDLSPALHLPLFLDEYGQDLLSRVAPRLGWLGYQAIEAGLGLVGNGEYLYARNCILPREAAEPAPADYNRVVGWDDLRPEQARLVEEAIGALRRSCPGHTLITKRYGASWSVLLNGRTLAKIIPQGDRVFVGVRVLAGGQPMGGSPSPNETRAVQGVIFQGCSLAAGSEGAERNRELKALADELGRQVGLA